MRIIKSIDLKMYACKVIFIIADDLVKAEKFVVKKYGGDPPQGLDANEAEAITFSLSNTVYAVVYDIKYLNHNVIAHEIYHAVRRITEHRDITDEENSAWICGYLTEEFYNFMSNPKTQATCNKYLEKGKDGGESEQPE